LSNGCFEPPSKDYKSLWRREPFVVRVSTAPASLGAETARHFLRRSRSPQRHRPDGCRYGTRCAARLAARHCARPCRTLSATRTMPPMLRRSARRYGAQPCGSYRLSRPCAVVGCSKFFVLKRHRYLLRRTGIWSIALPDRVNLHLTRPSEAEVNWTVTYWLGATAAVICEWPRLSGSFGPSRHISATPSKPISHKTMEEMRGHLNPNGA
jgi:hypothetical protein